MLEREVSIGMTGESYYRDFQPRAERVKDDLLTFLIDAKRQGKTVAAYGAAAKGNTLLNFAGVRPDLLRFVVDRNPAKQGKFMPGSHIPIVDESTLLAERPDVIIILPWNLRVEITQQLSSACHWKVDFVTAVPTIEFNS